MPWGPHLVEVDQTKNTYSLHLVIDAVSYITSGWFVQRVVLLLLLLGSMCGIYKLLKTIQPSINDTIVMFASVLYVFNPFFSTRFVAGQWLVLIGYLLLPWTLRALYIFFKKLSIRTSLPVALYLTLIGLTSIHVIGIVLIAAAALVMHSGAYMWKKKILYITAIVITWCILSISWVGPLIAGDSQVRAEIESFSKTEMEAFATHGTILDSPPISAALLTGFWADDTNRYILPSQLPVWWIGVFIIMTMVITGIVQAIKRRDKLGYTFISLGVISWLLGIGIAWNVSAPLTELLAHIVPYYNGYREPHKWLMLLTLVYVYLAAIGAQWLYTRIARYKSIWLNYGFVTLLFVSPFLFAPTLAWGAAGQLKSVEYPQQWQEAKTYLNTNTDKNTTVLVLPWHMYLPISFVGRVVGNPSGYYFDQKMITGNNFELKGVQDQRQTPLTKYVNSTLSTPSSFPKAGVGENLRKYDVEYVLLLKEADWQNYTWLNSQSKIKPVVSNDKLILYKVER
ncbi:hypothetical protein HY312_01515 [Candidatus Saccharibacteria bacterium]|nr:hypothetical protein [Candidatus Saccharibacteria bacterium]